MKKIETTVFPDIEPTGDKLFRIIELAAGLVPTGGNILRSLLTAPYEKRLEKWCQEVTNTVNILVEKNNITIEDMQANDTFVDFLLSLTQTAVKTSQSEKLHYLKNALLNSTAINFDDQDEYHYYLALIDSFSLAHIVVLNAYRGVCAGCKDEFIHLTQISNYAKKPYIYRQVLAELIAKELIIVKTDVTYGIQVFRSPVGNKLANIINE